MKEHSPGPWMIDVDLDDGFGFKDTNGNIVCRFSKMPEYQDLCAMRTATELVEFLEEVLDAFCPKEQWEGTAVRKKADRILTLAKGWEA